MLLFFMPGSTEFILFALVFMGLGFAVIMSYILLLSLEKDMEILIQEIRQVNESLNKVIHSIMGSLHDTTLKINKLVSEQNRRNTKR